MKYVEPPVTKESDKFLGFCAVTPNRKFMRLFKRAGVRNVLISYHYIRKDPKFTQDVLKMVKARGGLFMTDSGVFSFINDKDFNADKFDWASYVVEYTNWLRDNKDYIFSACNLDADAFIGHDTVKHWNEKYFKPLEQHMNIIYVAHPNATGRGELDVVKEYCKEHDYIAVNEVFAKQASAIYQMAKRNKVAVHGLAWTKPTILMDYPFFSVDSSSWVNYQKYGATPVWDGKNFAQYDKDDKNIRRTLRKQCEKYGIKEYEFVNEVDEGTDKHNDDEGLTYSLRTWMDVFQDLKRFARTKLSITLGSKLEGIAMEFKEYEHEEKRTAKGVKPRGGIEAAIGGKLGDGVIISDSKENTYTVDEEGKERLMVSERLERVPIDIYTREHGDVMMCNNCHVADTCPKFEADASCAFNFAPSNFTENPMAVIDMLILAQTERVNRAMFFEKMEGGMPNKVFATEIKLLADLNNQKTNMLLLMQNKGLKVTQTTVEINGMDDGTPKREQGGFAQMFKSLMEK